MGTHTPKHIKPPDMYYDMLGHGLTMTEWAEQMERLNSQPHPFGYPTARHIGYTTIRGVNVSTVWLGINTALTSPPLIFETLVFGGPLDQEMVRYPDLHSAALGHQRMVDRVFATQSFWYRLWHGYPHVLTDEKARR